MTVAIGDRLDTDAMQEAGIVVARDADNSRACAPRELNRNRADAFQPPPAPQRSAGLEVPRPLCIPWRIQPSSSSTGKAALKMRRRLFLGLLTGIEFIATLGADTRPAPSPKSRWGPNGETGMRFAVRGIRLRCTSW